MTDEYNTPLSEDKNIISALLTQDAQSTVAFSAKKNEEEGGNKKKEKAGAAKLAELYEKGIAHFASRGIIIENCSGGLHCGHNILVKDYARQIKGINYPGWFTPYRHLFSNSDFKQLESAYIGLKEPELLEFWEPLVQPRPGDSMLAQYSHRLNMMKRVESRYTMTDTFFYNQTHDPSENGVFGARAETPRTWIPAKEWFDERLRNEVTFDDIFCIFPEAERNILKLWIGRIGVGRSNHQPPNASSPIEHTARMAVVVLSKEAGIGKSTITNYLYGALNKCGFEVESFKDTRDRFGMANGAMAHILQKDDVSEESLLRFLQSEETKILITNGSLRVEEKFQAAETIFPRCSILLNSNSWNSSFGYSIDSGIMSRIKIISTYSKAELLRMRDNIDSVALQGCPDLRPFAALPWLANKYNVDIDTLMLWSARLASDYFYETITKLVDPSINSLEETVYYHTNRLRYRFRNEILESLVYAMALSSALTAIVRNEDPYLPEFNFSHLYEMCKDFYFISVDPSMVNFCTYLKEDWESKGRTSFHPYQSLRDLRVDTLKQALEWAQSEYIDFLNGGVTLKTTESEVLKRFVSFISLRCGFKLGGGISYFIDAINTVAYNEVEIFELANKLLDKLKETDEEAVNSLTKYAKNLLKVNDDWMSDRNYSPRIAEKLRQKARRKVLGRGV